MSDGWRLLIGALVVWRLSHLFSAEDGPASLLVWVRRRAGSGAVGKSLDCFSCLSLWLAVPVALWVGASWLERALLVPALSGAAILAERLTARAEPPAVAWFHEETEEDNAVLRKESERASEPGSSTNRSG